MTNKDAVYLFSDLSILADKKLPIKISYAVLKNLKVLKSELELYEEQRKKIVKDDESPTTEEIKSVAELLDLEIGTEVIKFDATELEKLEDDKFDVLTPAQLGTLISLSEVPNENH